MILSLWLPACQGAHTHSLLRRHPLIDLISSTILLLIIYVPATILVDNRQEMWGGGDTKKISKTKKFLSDQFHPQVDMGYTLQTTRDFSET
jgi:hypothetical protein